MQFNSRFGVSHYLWMVKQTFKMSIMHNRCFTSVYLYFIINYISNIQKHPPLKKAFPGEYCPRPKHPSPKMSTKTFSTLILFQEPQKLLPTYKTLYYHFLLFAGLFNLNAKADLWGSAMLRSSTSLRICNCRNSILCLGMCHRLVDILTNVMSRL